ncbi:MAG: hypothetical protein V4609_20190 [Pseudomonadota bacterium]
MRSLLLIPALALWAGAACAQAPAAAPRPPALERQPLEGRTNQKIEYIRHEDAGSRIDEVRHGGEVERVTVQPKAGVPAYEIQTHPLSGTRRGDPREGLSGAGAPRAWNVLRF